MSRVEYPNSHPPVEFNLEPTSKFCTYGGACSVHIKMAGKELLRYEAADPEDAQQYIDNLEHYQPRLRDGEWELVIFTYSGFQTLYLNSKNEPQCVMSYCKATYPGRIELIDRIETFRVEAAKLYGWRTRRQIEGTRTESLAAVLSVLNYLRTQHETDAGLKFIQNLCPLYKVQKGVKSFTKVAKR